MPEAIPARLGRYTLLKPLARGGMAELFLARAEGIEGFSKLVVLKRILPHRAAEEKYVRMFLAEARLVATLDHPNIAHVYDIGIENDEYFFAMEYVHGQDVRKIQRRALGHRLRLDHALHVGIGVSAGLHFAHEATGPDGRSLGLVHRDVSPHNVLVSYDGAVKLVDFGVAKARTVTAETKDGLIKGKYGYLSPEQALAEQLDRRSDVFALGILLWEMTVGRRLYKVDGELQTLQRIVYVDAPRPSTYVSDYPPELEAIVMKALARPRETRFQTAQELQVALEQFAASHRLVVSSVSMGQEMHLLFAREIEAWKQAERAGRSLAEHVVDVAEDIVFESGSSDEAPKPELSEVLDGLGTATPDPATATRVEKPSTTSSSSKSKPGLNVSAASLSKPVQVDASAPKRRSGIVILVVGLVVIGGAGGYMLWSRGRAQPSATRTADAGTSMADLVLFDAGSTQVVEPTPEPDAAVPAIVAGSVVAIDAAPADEPNNAKTVKRPKKGHKSGHADDTKVTVSDDPDLERPPADDPKDPPKPPPPPAVDAGVAHVGSAAPVGPPPGTMDAAQVRAAVKAHLGDISTCVERAKMDDRDLAGKITMRIDVTGTGQVAKVRVAARTVENHGLEDCMMRAISSWTFPAPAGGVAGAFSYPFSF